MKLTIRDKIQLVLAAFMLGLFAAWGLLIYLKVTVPPALVGIVIATGFILIFTQDREK